jgi:hypothetical protein
VRRTLAALAMLLFLLGGVQPAIPLRAGSPRRMRRTSLSSRVAGSRSGSPWSSDPGTSLLTRLKVRGTSRISRASGVTIALVAGALAPGTATRAEAMATAPAFSALAHAYDAPKLSLETRTAVVTNNGAKNRVGRSVPPEQGLDWALSPPEAKIARVVEKYGMNLRGKKVVFDPKLTSAGRARAADPNTLRIGPDALVSEEELARTVAHEWRHSRAYGGSGSNEEDAAQAAENALGDFINGRR